MPAKPDRRSPIRCRICNGNARRIFSRFDFEFARCAACGCLQKLLTPDQYARLEVTYDPGTLFEGVNPADLRDLFEVGKKIEFLRTATRGLDVAKPRLLDIGCGQGEYLLAAKDLGWDATGIEPSQRHSDVGRELFGLKIITGHYKSGLFKTEKFDVVILSHVIEHIRDVANFVDDVLRVLAPAGLLVVVTPNAASVVARITGRYWPMLKPPDHVTMMTPGAFRALAKGRFTCKIRTTEFIWEPLATLIQSARDYAKEKILKRRPAPSLGAAGRIQLKRRRLQTLLGILSIFSLPLHLAAVALGRSACLLVVIRLQRATVRVP